MRLMLVAAIVFSSMVDLEAQQKPPVSLSIGPKNGIASSYHNKFNGKKTVSGDIFSNSQYTAACNCLKLGCYVKVTNETNGEFVYVKVNDRMAKNNARLIDLAGIAARKLKFEDQGVAKVKVEVATEEDYNDAMLRQKLFSYFYFQPLADR
jgi:rare lipoprotein A